MTIYKQSFYNIEVFHNNSIYIYNPFRGVLKINPDLYKSLKNLHKTSSEHIQLLFENGLIVDEYLDEFKKVNLINQISKLNMNHLRLSISPTFLCNLDCNYCFVKKDDTTMNNQVMNDILLFVEDRLRAGIKSFKVTWFGGEPLMAMNQLEYLSRNFISLCNEYNCKYETVLITNGTLLNAENLKRIKNLNINRLQVTLDGPERIHNRQRFLKYGNSFEKTILNLKRLEDVKINLRINLYKDSYKHIFELLEILNDELISKNINDITISPVFETEYMSKENKNKCFDIKEYAEIEVEILEQIINKGFSKKFDIRRLDVGNSKEVLWDMNIDPCGNVYKDEFYMGNEKYIIGNIKDISLKTIINNPYAINCIMSSEKMEEKCGNCKILPICMNGDIQRMSCISLKYNIVEQIKLYIDSEVIKNR